MNGTKLSLKMFFLWVAFVMMVTAGGIGWYYQKGVFIGPYLMPGSKLPVYLEFPIIAL